MQLLVRDLSGSTQVLQLKGSDHTVESLETALQARGQHAPGAFQYVYAGRQLAPGRSLGEYGVDEGSVVAQVARLLGGKGGFGAMLRGAGRTGKLTDNFDACRDLSGRRVRHQEAEKRLAEWAADQKERELEKVAQQHIKKQLREEKLRLQEEMEAKLAADVQVHNIRGVREAVTSGLAAAGEGSKRKGGGSGGTSPLQKKKALKVWGMEEVSDDSDEDSEDGEEEEREQKMAAGAAPPLASVDVKGKGVVGEESSGDEGSTETKTEVLLSVKHDAPAPPASAEPGPKVAPHQEEESAPYKAVDLSPFSTAEELQSLGLEALKAELAHYGLKCGGTLQQRAERLYLVKTTPLEKIDKANKAKK